MEKGSEAKTGLDLSREKIVQFSLVVRDLERVAKRFSEIFGIRWRVHSLDSNRLVLRNRAHQVGCSLKIALGDFGGRSLKLVQPLSGPSSYLEFLQKNGEGFYTIGFGTLLNHDHVVGALQDAGVLLEMQGGSGNGSRFSIMDTTEDLGCRIEFSSPGCTASDESSLVQTGIVVPEGSAFVDMEEPVFPGGKKINQVGLVVKDEKKAARCFEELLGIGGWNYDYGPPGLVNCSLNGKPVPESAVSSLDVAFAMGWLGDIQIEIIRPIGLRPGGCHQLFIDKHGNGIQHVSFGVQPDYGAFVNGMKRAGIGVEFGASIKEHGVSVSYLATQAELGGFQLEIVGRF